MSITLAPLSLPDGTLDVVYSSGVSASGGTGPYTYLVLMPDPLPDGLLLDINTGAITGTPTWVNEPGVVSFTIRATDALAATGDQAYSITLLNPLSLDDVLPDGALSAPYSSGVTAAGGVAPYEYLVLMPDPLPDGLLLDIDTGAVTGTPSELNGAGTFSFTLRATDANGHSVDRAYSIVLYNPIVLDDVLPDGIVNIPYSASVTASAGVAPYEYLVLMPDPPPYGIDELDIDSGLLHGTPLLVGVYDFRIQATDALGHVGSRGYSINIRVQPANDGGSSGPGPGHALGHGDKKKKHKKPGAVETSASSASDFNFGSTDDAFDAAVEAAEPLPPPRDVLIDDGIPITPLDHDLVRTAFDAADDALLAAARHRDQIAAHAAATRQQQIAAQHAIWDRNALLIAVVNAALAA